MEQRIIAVGARRDDHRQRHRAHRVASRSSGVGVIKMFFHPGANIGAAIAQVTRRQTALAQLPPGTTPPLIIRFNATNVPILQLGLSSKTLSEQQINDYASNFVRVQLATVQGPQWPGRTAAKSARSWSTWIPRRSSAKGISRPTSVNAINAQNLILPSGTAKIGRARVQGPPQHHARRRQGAERPADQAGQRRHGLHPRRGASARRVRGSDQHRAGERPRAAPA